MKTLLIILAVIVAIAIITAVANTIIYFKLMKFVKSVNKVEYKNQLIPTKVDGVTTFTTDKDFNILHLTDIHIGCGWMSCTKSLKALKCVANMVEAKKPDLVVITGDIAYPVPFQSGTFNNKTSAKLFANLMDNLGVYWAICLGNHDTEMYSYFSRKQMGKYYATKNYKVDKTKKDYCLFEVGSSEISGVGNYVINVASSKGIITQSLIILDSHSYIDGDYFGFMWKYDNLHQDQIDWYTKQIEKSTAINKDIDPNSGVVSSLVFFHIPLREYKDALDEYRENGNKDTENVKHYYGDAKEKNRIVYHGLHYDTMFETARKLGSTKGFFCGHDHLNNFSMDYKGIRLTYGMSVDYLAYIGIDKYGEQRGGAMITSSPSGEFETKSFNYYQENLCKDDYSKVTFKPYNGN